MANNPDVSTRRRVKLYMLNEDRQWDDKGTGHVSATLVETNSMALVVISETDGSHLLESKIQHDTAYQKQQETLIVWSEGDNVDLALSFQEKTGCDDIWEKICNVQGKDPSVDITQDLIDENDDAEDMEDANASAGTNQGFEFPVCDLNHLLEINEMFTQVINFPIQRERIASALERTQYMKQLIDLFHKAEALEDLTSLHHLYEITRAIIQFNRRSLYDMIFSDEYLMDIVGMLEYNPNKRVKHREFILNKSNFKEIISISGPLKAKIHQTYRVQYIQDNCLPPPSLFDDNVGSSLNSFIFLNKIDIINKLQDDSQFFIQLFNKFMMPDLLLENRIDLLGLLKEFCSIVHSLQTAQKESFFNTLCQHKALKAIFFSFKSENDRTKALCVDILQIFVENQPSIVREFFLSDSRENSGESLYINVLIDHLINDLDSELSTGFLIMNMLKMLLDPENMINSGQRTEKQEFLNFFYKNSMQHLTQPLVDLTADNELRYDDYHTAMVMHDIVELLAFCVEYHSYHMKNFAFYNNILVRVVTLFKSQHKFLVLAALRVIRKYIAAKEEFNFRYINKNNILRSIVLLLDKNRQYNMLNSAILELFEFIKGESITCLINNLIENNWEILQHHNYVPVFKQLKSKYDQSIKNAVLPGASSTTTSGGSSISMLSVINPVSTSRLRRDPRSLDEDEEQWYDQDDEDDDDFINSSSLYTSTANFIERISRNMTDNNSSSGSADSTGTDSPPFKLNARCGQQQNQQQIPINIKSTSLTLGVNSVGVASATASGCVSGATPTTTGGTVTSSTASLSSNAENSATVATSDSNAITTNTVDGSSLPESPTTVATSLQNGSITVKCLESENHQISTSSDCHKECSEGSGGVNEEAGNALPGLVDYEDDEDDDNDHSVVSSNNSPDLTNVTAATATASPVDFGPSPKRLKTE